MARHSRHHILPSSRGGTNVPENIVRLTTNVHEALHILLSNMTPTEQIDRLLNIGDTALRGEFKEAVRRELAKHPDYIYERGIYRKR